MKYFCYVIAALCAFLGVASILSMLGTVDLGLEIREATVGVMGTCMGIYLGRKVGKLDGNEDQHGGPTLFK